MNEETEQANLDFEKVQYDSFASATDTACPACGKPLQGIYFDVNGQGICESCKSAIEDSINADTPTAALVIKAVLFGLGAAIAGALLYYAVVYATGYEVGLISILVGYIVGKAVFFGSGNRGGRGYQVLAVLLTYLAIVSTYLPLIFDEVASSDEYTQTESPTTPIAESAGAEPQYAGQNDGTAQQATQEAATPVDYLMLLGFFLALPFLAGLENIIGLLIIGFGLYQAWATSKKIKINITGPFQIAVDDPSAPE